MRRLLLACTALSFLAGCNAVPKMVATDSGDPVAQAGPKVADLMVNLKCELMTAANSTTPLKIYGDAFDMANNGTLGAKKIRDLSDEQYNKDNPLKLRSLFQEIHYVAEIQLTLDVKENSAINPSLSATDTVSKIASLALSVAPSYNSTAERNIVLYESVDFDRLVPPNDQVSKGETPPAVGCSGQNLAQDTDNKKNKTQPTPQPFGGRDELGGDLKLGDTMATAIEAISMSDIGIFGDNSTSVSGVDKPFNYQFGQFSTQVNFTIAEGGSIGSTWSLSPTTTPNWSVKYPASSSTPLLSATRTVTDTLVITFVPVCIRQEYQDVLGANKVKGSPPPNSPKIMAGTPHWADLLPGCNVPTPPKPVPNYEALLTNLTNKLNNDHVPKANINPIAERAVATYMAQNVSPADTQPTAPPMPGGAKKLDFFRATEGANSNAPDHDAAKSFSRDSDALAAAHQTNMMLQLLNRLPTQ